MSKKKVKVTVDRNEAAQNPELTSVLALHEDVEEYDEETLSEGDIQINDSVLIERKTPSDFASSLQEGRLREQVERMGGRKMQSFVLIEGDMTDFDKLHSDIPSKSLRGMVASIAARNRVQIIFCSDQDLLADTAIRLGRKVEEEPTSIQTKTTDSVKEPTFMENMFMGVESVGYKTAKKLASSFGSAEEAYNAEVSDYTKVDDVGDVTAEKIHSALHNRESGSKSEPENEPSTEVYSV